MYKLFKRSHIPGSFEVQAAGACDTGIARDHNEDAIAINIKADNGTPGYYLSIVCDGMGGHNAGEIASAVAVSVIGEHIQSHLGSQEPPELMTQAFRMANAAIDEQAEINPEARGMGCTAVAVLGVKDRLWVAHSGDSRAYRIRDGEASQLTTDHTMVQEMLDSGLLTPEQAAVHPYRGRISRCLGHGKNRFDPDVGEADIKVGDSILLCSDGLSDVVKKEDLEKHATHRDLRTACRRLIEAANENGGPDNISAIVMRRVV